MRPVQSIIRIMPGRGKEAGKNGTFLVNSTLLCYKLECKIYIWAKFWKIFNVRARSLL